MGLECKSLNISQLHNFSYISATAASTDYYWFVKGMAKKIINVVRVRTEVVHNERTDKSENGRGHSLKGWVCMGVN